MTSVTELEQFLMFGRLRHWAEAGAVFAGLALGVSAAPGYLPAVGPVPLRFRPTPPPAEALVQMPLPPPDPPSPAPDIPSPLSAAANTATNKTPPAASPSSVPVIATATNGPAQPDANPSGSEPRISPQMLLRYFSRSTNGAAGGMMAPVDFAPPAAATPPSSTATYSTEPK